MNAPRPSADRLERLVDRFPRRKVAVLGDFGCDEFIYGEIARISREAPVLILEHDRTVVVPGGAGNAVANLRALGADPIPLGVVGKDASGVDLLRQFKDAGIDTRGIRAEAGYGTPTKSRILAGGVHTRRQQIVRVDRGAKHGKLTEAMARALTQRAASALRRAEGLVVADYGYGAAPPEIFRALRPALGEKPVFVDSRGRVAGFRAVGACTPNQEELEMAMGTGTLRSDRAVAAAGAALRKKTGNDAVLVTRGAKGMVLFEKDGAARAIPAFGAGEVADVTGAGDTVIAVFALARLAGGTWAEAAVLANMAAGLVVMKYGTATVSPAELVAAIHEDAAS